MIFVAVAPFSSIEVWTKGPTPEFATGLTGENHIVRFSICAIRKLNTGALSGVSSILRSIGPTHAT
jgi:hypothetical protein